MQAPGIRSAQFEDSGSNAGDLNGFFRDFCAKKHWPKSTSGRGKGRQSGGFWTEPPGPRAGGSQPAPAPFTSLPDAPRKSLLAAQIRPIGGPSRTADGDEWTAEVDLGR